MSGSGVKRAAVQRSGSAALDTAAPGSSGAPGPKGDTWIAKWREGGRQVQRGLGFVHSKHHPDGSTRAEAEAALGKLREQVAIERTEERAGGGQAGGGGAPPDARPGRRSADRRQARRRGPTRSTIEAYSYWLRIHIVDYFGPMPVGDIAREDVRGFAAALERKGLAPKSRANALGTLHSLIEFAIDEGWMVGENPVKRVEKPALAARPTPTSASWRPRKSRRCSARSPRTSLGSVERVMYLTAAMTGMRQGELFALRWRDVDWSARRIRVRRNYVRGQFGTPKSKRSARSVPLASRVAVESLSCCSRIRRHQRDDDLVFAHPATGNPIDRSKLLKRFKAALRRADVRAVRFHDLRHTFDTRMAAQGMPMRVLQELMGHRDFKTTLIYADYARAREKWNGWRRPSVQPRRRSRQCRPAKQRSS